MRQFVTVVLVAFLNPGSCPHSCPLVPPAVRAAEPSSDVVVLGRTRFLTGIEHVLAKPISMEFLDAPLRAVLVQIQDKTDVAVTCDIEALDEVGCDLDEIVVTRCTENVPLASTLDSLCESLDLEWIVLDDEIEITTPEGASRRMTRLIDVTDITDDPSSLAELLEASVQPDAWARHGGQGVIRSDATRGSATLIVTSSWQVHRGVAGVIEGLRRSLAVAQTASATLGVGGYWSDAANAVAARKALDTPLTRILDFDETPLLVALLALSDSFDISIMPDVRALDEAGIDLDAMTVTQQLSTTRPLARLLDQLLAPSGLTWELRHDLLTVTTPHAARVHQSVAIYPLGGSAGDGHALSKLIDTVQATVTPDAWQAAGGEAFIGAFRSGERSDPCCLVVRHTSAGHRAVGEFLNQLRPQAATRR